MLPAQPFYSLVRTVLLNSVTSVESPGVVSYFGNFTTTPVSRRRRKLVLVHFSPEPQSPAVDGDTATVIVNDMVYRGLPFTMINITQLLNWPHPTVFTLRFEDIPAHVRVEVGEVSKASEQDLLRGINASSPFVHKKEDTKALIEAFFTEGQEVLIETIQVSLVCPVEKTKMRVPCRGIRCPHVQCFDAFAYLGFNESTLQPSWRCPLCSHLVFVQDIRVDLFTLDILRRAGELCFAVLIRADGRWRPVPITAP